jgi:hypothetical protein
MKANNWIEFYRTIPEKTSVSNFNTIGFCEIKRFHRHRRASQTKDFVTKSLNGTDEKRQANSQNLYR